MSTSGKHILTKEEIEVISRDGVASIEDDFKGVSINRAAFDFVNTTTKTRSDIVVLDDIDLRYTHDRTEYGFWSKK